MQIPQRQTIPATHWQTIKKRINKLQETRNLESNISKASIEKLFLGQNGNCALSGEPLSFRDNTASLDRIDSSKGYIHGNIQWVHKQVNQMKWNFPEKTFLRWIKKIHRFQTNNNSPAPNKSTFPISEFKNPSGKIVWRVAGYLDRKQIRKNFKTLEDAKAFRKQLLEEIQSRPVTF